MTTTFTKDILYNLLSSNICSVVFTKINGEERIMTCTLMPSKIPASVKNDSKMNENFMAVYDLDLEAWRGFRVDSIKSITITN